MENVPLYIPVFFSITVLLSIFILSGATQHSGKFWLIMLCWVMLQSICTLTGFYTVMNSLPPRFLWLILPPLLGIIFLFNTRKGKRWIDQLDIKALVILHVVRIPVELVLYWLSVHKAVPVLLTFEGVNFDIFSGLSAPVVYYFFFVKKINAPLVLLTWNITCMLLLINVVARAILSVPTPFQQFAFDQPMIAIAYFPFSLLPGCIVPIVLFSHLVIFRKLLIRHTPNDVSHH